MRVSNTVVVLAWFGLWLQPGDTRGQAPKSVPPKIPKLLWPTTLDGRITSGFGPRTRSDVREFHGAIDIGVRESSPVFAAADGRVAYRHQNYGGHGDALIIDHSGGYTTVYGHIRLSRELHNAMTRGEQPRVRAGQEIGTVVEWSGNNHLHFGIHAGAFDPGNVNASLRGIYPATTDPARITALDPKRYVETPEELAKRLGKDIAELFDGKKVEPVELAKPKKEGSAVTLVAIQFRPPEGASVSSWNDGLGGTGMTVRGSGETVTVQKHPGFSGEPYTPQGVANGIIQLSWRRGSKQDMTVGKDRLPGLRLVGPGGIQAVLFTCGRGVYWSRTPGVARSSFLTLSRASA